MFRSRKFVVAVLGSLMFAAVLGLIPPQTASANPTCGGYNNPAVGYADIYTYTIYYRYNNQILVYGRFFKTVYSNGAVDWGGGLQARDLLNSQGLAWQATNPVFWRRSFNAY